MNIGKPLSLPIIAFITVIISFFAYSLIASSSSEPSTEQNKQQENSSNNDSDVINNVENNVNSDQSEVNNEIDNQLNNSSNNKIENNITNNVEVNIDVNVTNNITNNINNEAKSNNDKNNENENSKDSNKDDQEQKDEVVWGVDSASLTTDYLLACVRENFGNPEIWGRYLGEKEGVSSGLTNEEVDLLHSNNIKILVIWNHFADATGFENGQSEAKEAIQLANTLGIPEGVAIFADIEPNYPVDSEFIRGWYEIMNDSKYVPGIYGIFDEGKSLNRAFNQAAENNPEILANTYIWTAAPNNGITTEANAPEYQPNAPANTKIGGWQYGIDAEACNIDTNLFSSKIMDILW